MFAIDYDRGVQKRLHPTGISVFMYKDQPGVFYNAHGKEVAPSLATECGYKTERLLREKLRREKMTAAQIAIDEEFGYSDKQHVVVAERDGYQLVDIGLDRFIIEDNEGVSLTPRHLTRAESQAVFDKVVPIAD